MLYAFSILSFLFQAVTYYMMYKHVRSVGASNLKAVDIATSWIGMLVFIIIVNVFAQTLLSWIGITYSEQFSEIVNSMSGANATTNKSDAVWQFLTQIIVVSAIGSLIWLIIVTLIAVVINIIVKPKERIL